ncbi:hypothetical protein [Chryseobacterium sp.]|uniref:hypothetical protein n=1 Tax=Chryseobacterium sp. TaxID=1871047 RepID=UPI0024E209E1|nr:hypothetical protein [Chryseobacterium sp.]
MATEKEIEYLNSNFEYKGLLTLGFFSKEIKPKDYDAQIQRICNWFGITNIFQYDIVMMENNKYIKPEIKIFSHN